MWSRAILKGGTILAIGYVSSALAAFLRNLVVARLLSVEDFGIASLFALSIAIVEMVSNLGIDRMLIQASDGDDQRMQASGQAFQALRGFGTALVLYLASDYMAIFFGVPDVAWAFKVLAAVPAIRGVMHLDVVRYQRKMKFAAFVGADIAPQLATLGLAAPLCQWLGDFRAMLWIVVLQAIFQVITSHLVATRAYVWAWDREMIRRMIAFGWPLMINGLLMFIILQGDRALVGHAFTMTELGWYSAAFMLALAPAMIIANVLRQTLSPLLSQAQDDLVEFGKKYLSVIQVHLLAGQALAAGLIIAGPGLLVMFFGERYAEGAVVMIWLGFMQGVRIVKEAPMLAAVALGKTRNPMYSNAVRIVTLFAAAMAVAQGAGVVAVAIAGLIGEFVSLVISLVLLRRTVALPLSHVMTALITALVTTMLVGICAEYYLTDMKPPEQVLLGGIGAVMASGVVLMSMPSVAKWCWATGRESLMPKLENQ